MADHEFKPFILDLPNEVLTEILDRFARIGEPTKPILFVCRRFYQLGIPVHYKRLKLSSSEHVSRPKPRLVELQRTLQKEPGLGEYCRDLCICSNDANDSDSNDRNSGENHHGWDDGDWSDGNSDDMDVDEDNADDSDPDYNPDKFPILQNIASYLTNVHSLEIYGGLGMDEDGGSYSVKNRDTWCLFRSFVARMPSLRTVSLRGRMHGQLDVRELMDTLKGTSFRRLILHGFEFAPIHQWTPQVCIANPLKNLQNRHKHSLIRFKEFGPSCINELDLELHPETPTATACLLEWPETLTSLTFKSNCSGQKDMDLPRLGSMLRKHKDSLVKLSIGPLAKEGMGKLFDFSAFGAMEELELVMQQIVPNWPAKFGEEDYSSLLPPNLRILKVGIFGSGNDNYAHFDGRAGSWLRGYAKTAVRQKVPLREIVIDAPVLSSKPSRSIAMLLWGRLDAPEFDQYWGGIEALEKDLWSMGIALTY